MGYPPADVAEEKTLDVAPGQRGGEVEVSKGAGTPKGGHGHAVSCGATKRDGST